MRKTDYAALADTLKKRREHYTAQNKQDIADAIEVIAHVLASKLSVDKAAFLRACGIG